MTLETFTARDAGALHHGDVLILSGSPAGSTITSALRAFKGLRCVGHLLPLPSGRGARDKNARANPR
ncbi:MAG: hypothetical protein EOP40_14450 [Rubrivivax sp.]|nr:MAG: hypothetical protein EOP40_14450 [Rubrivivax sp.]